MIRAREPAIVTNEDNQQKLARQQQNRKALELLPTEIWCQIISQASDDVLTLDAIHRTCTDLRAIAEEPLLARLVQSPVLEPLYRVAQKRHPDAVLRDIALRMHRHADEALEPRVGYEPLKWTDDVSEWDSYDQSRPHWQNVEDFRREVGRKGKARSRSHVVWETHVELERRQLRQELAKCWAVQGKFFPFSRDENRAWKKRREKEGVKTPSDSVHKVDGKADRKTERKLLSSPPSNKKSKNVSEQRYHQNGGKHAGGSSNGQQKDDWLLSYQIRNQAKPQRPSIDKGEEEFHRKILARYVTPRHYLVTDSEEEEKEERSSEANGAGKACTSINKNNNKRAQLNSTEKMLTALVRFHESSERVLKFSPRLSSYQRKELHMQANNLGLRSLSFGKDNGRFLVVLRKDVKIFD